MILMGMRKRKGTLKFQKLKRYGKSIVDEECGPSGNILVFLVVLMEVLNYFTTHHAVNGNNFFA